VRREGLEWLLASPFCTKRFAYTIGAKCRTQTIQDVAKENMIDWHTIKELDKRYMEEQLKRADNLTPRVIGIDEISVKKRHTYRIVASDLEARRPI
jgi:transposase